LGGFVNGGGGLYLGGGAHNWNDKNVSEQPNKQAY